MSELDWEAWHADYDVAGSSLARRLVAVQRRVSDALDACPPGPIQVVSACAGQGRDLLEVLATHPRRDDVSARLVELDPRNTAFAAGLVERHGLERIEIVTGDASLATAYAGAVPANLVLLCGIFGNISDPDIARTAALSPMLCAPGAVVIWTRHRVPPDLTPSIRQWFTDAGFAEVAFDAAEDALFGVGTARLNGEPLPLDPTIQFFTFIGHGREAFL